LATEGGRPLRADARRNREAILRAARATFDRDGILAPIDGIATAAGVGNATFYRNFPTRDDLLAAVMDDSVRDVLERSEAIERDLPPAAALREWLYQLTWNLRIWQNLPTCIATAIDDAASPVQTVCARLTARTGDFLERARGTGAAADGVTAEDLFELVTALSWAVDRFGDSAQRARERVALATAGVFGVNPPDGAADG
jgi:AcrR family transcriptional regulator